MTSKRTCSCKPSSSYFKYFYTQAQENNFNMYYSYRELYVSHYMDEELFKYCTFMDAFNFAGIRNFIFEKPQEIYTELVRMFYANLSKMSS